MTRIALLLSGLPRLWRECLPSQLALFPGAELDLFCHFWDAIAADEKEALRDMLRPKACVFEAQKDFSAVDADPRVRRDAINVPSRLMSQYYSWRAVGDLFAPVAARYDFAVRSRTDLQFIAPLEGLTAQLGPEAIFMPWWERDKLLADLFAVGGPGPILHYHRLYDHALDYADEIPFNPELLLMRHLRARPRTRILTEGERKFFVRRPHMAGYTVEQAMAENPGQNKWLNPEVVAAHKAYFTRMAGAAGGAHVERFRQGQLAALTEEEMRRAAAREAP